MASRRKNSEEISIPGGLILLSILGYFQRDTIWAWLIANPSNLTWIIIGASLFISLLIFGLWRSRLRSKENAYRHLLTDQARQLQPSQFEHYIETLLLSLGWSDVKRVGGSGDGGVDLYASKNELRYVVQCKRYKDLVPPHYIRELYGTLQHKGADRALLVTTGRVSNQTREWIKDKPIEIWDGTKLSALLAVLQRSTTEPNYIAKDRRSAQKVFFALGIFNLIMLLGAFIAPSYLPAASSLAQSPTASPTISPQATPTQEATSTTVATPIPNEVKAYALVSQGGNLRAAASMQGEVLGLIKIADRLELLGKSEDGEWLQVKTEQDLAGWVHKTLLSIDPEVEAILTNIP